MAIQAQQIKCKASRDVWLSTQGKESDYSMGKANKIKLKVIQEFGIIDFDVSRLKGKTIGKAWLYVKPAGGHKWGLRGNTDLRLISLSTVGKEWVEGKNARYGNDTRGFGATFRESSYTKANWGWEGAEFPNVTFGNMKTIRHDAELSQQAGGWHRMPVDPQLVKALIAGATHGLSIVDGSTSYIMNCYIHSSESRGNEPYLLVETTGTDTTAPPPVAELAAKPAPNWATYKHGAIKIMFTVPKGAFSYDVKINGKPVDRWQIPFAAESGTKQWFPIVDLQPSQEVELSISVCDAAGNRSSIAKKRIQASPRITVPKLPAMPFKPSSGRAKSLGSAKIWAFPEVTKVNPTSGKVHAEKVSDIRAKNAVWDGATGTVRLAAAKGEIISFQLAIEGAIQGVRIDVSQLSGPGSIPSKGIKLWRNWYVKGQSEYAIPLKGTIGCPMADNRISGQRLQAVTIDYHIPIKTTAGDYTGSIKLSADGKQVTLPLKVKVYNVTIPETVFFNPELNCYGGPGKAGSAQFKDSYRLAHYHRCTINRVPYSQSGKTHQDYIPATDPTTGRVTDWSQFDKSLGGLLDGSWFKDNPRAGVPVATLYLPHYEGYPLDYQKYYKAGVPFESGTQAKMTHHHIRAKNPADALTPAYQKAFKANVRDFYQHFQQKGYTKTICQMYLNNKGWKGGYALWTLDEPHKTLDWVAINFWGELWKEGINDPEVYTRQWHSAYFKSGGVTAMNRSRPTFLYRGDISRSRYQGSFSDKNMTIMYGGGSQRHLRCRRAQMPAILYTYGSANAPGRSNWESAAWCLRAYTMYQDGVLPWQSLGSQWNMENGDRSGGGNALIVDSGKFGFGHAIASFRVHAMRRGAQDCELLRLLQLKNGWSREHIEQIVLQKVGISSKHRVSDAASAVTFQTLGSQGFLELKEGILQLLTK